MSLLVAIIAVLPLVAAMLATVFGRHGAMFAAAAVVGMLAAVIALVVNVARGVVVTVEVGGWSAPLGITLQADGLACVFLAMTAFVMAGVVAQGRIHFANTGPEARATWAFWPLAMLLWTALNVVFLSRDLFNLYVGLEFISLAAVALVAIEEKSETLAAALRYMLTALLGSLLYLLGTVLLYSAHGVLDIGLIAGRTPVQTDLLAVALMTAGIAAKMALFAFHAWLPPAHSGAPAPASAMLSALVLKTAFVILIRLWFEAVPDLASTAIPILLGSIGAAAILHGGVMALRQDRLKLVIAYSTVAQIGYLLLIFPLAGGVNLRRNRGLRAHGPAQCSMRSVTGLPKLRCSCAQGFGSPRSATTDLKGCADRRARRRWRCLHSGWPPSRSWGCRPRAGSSPKTCY